MKKSHLIASILFIVSLTGCVEPIRQDSSYFNCKKYFVALADSLQQSEVGLDKTIYTDYGKEQKNIDAPIWKTELSPFIEIDINKPALKGTYKIREENRPDSGSVVLYEALEENATVRKLHVEYDSQKNVTGVWAVTATSNPYHASTDTLIYLSNGTYEIHASSDPALGRRIAFDLYGKITANK
ncbi:MAG: hypothetical protein ACKO0X_07390 [Bacteroidota bacterium]